MKGKLLPIVCVLTLLGACSVPKDVAYFQGIDRLTTADLERMNQTYATTIAADDLLTINVTAWNTTVVAPFNPPPFAYIPQGETSVAADSCVHHSFVHSNSLLWSVNPSQWVHGMCSRHCPCMSIITMNGL